MRAVDTNVLVRLLLVDDEDQTRAADAFIRGGAWVSHLVLAETTWVLRTVYRHTPTEIADALTAALDTADLVFEDSEVVGDAIAAFRARPGMKFSDFLIVEIARKAGHGPVGTFDKDLAKMPGVERIRV